MQLFQKLKTLVFEDRYVIGQHASERLEERLDAQPNPIIAVHYFDEE